MSESARPPAEADFDPPIVPPPREGTASVSTQTMGCLIIALCFFAPVILYFGFFAVLVLDEGILQTRYLSPEKLPAPVVEGIRFIYAPLIDGVEVLFH